MPQLYGRDNMKFNVAFVVWVLAHIREALSDVEGSVLRGAAHFLAVGRIASPVYYETLVLRVDLNPAETNIVMSIKKGMERVLETMKVPGDRQEFKRRVTHRTKSHRDRFEQAVTQLKEVRGAAGLEKKSLVAIAAVLGPLVAVGSALFSHGEVRKMSRKLLRYEHRLNDVRKDIWHIHQAFDLLADKEESDNLVEETVEILNEMLQELTARYEETIKGIYAMKQHRLHPGLVPPHILVDIEKHVKDYVKKTGATPVFNIKEELLNLPISYIEGKARAHILLHIPMVSDARTMLRDLYQLDGAMLYSEGKIVRYRTPEPFISIDRTWGLHQTMSAAEIQQCHQVGTTRLCMDNNILMKTAVSCTAALFLKDQTATREFCTAEEITLKQPALQINVTSYAVRKGEKVTLRCPDGRPTTHETTGIEVFNVAPNCTLSSINFMVAQRPEEHQEVITVQHEYHETDMLDMVLNLTREDVKEQLQLEEEDEKFEDEDDEDIGDDDSSWLYLMITATVVAIAGVLVAAFCTCSTARHHLQRGTVKTDDIESSKRGPESGNCLSSGRQPATKSDDTKRGPGSGTHRFSGRQAVKDGALRRQRLSSSLSSLGGPATRLEEEEEE